MNRFADVVRKHHKESDGILVASSEPCVTIAHDERTHATGRTFRIIRPEALATLDLKHSWCMAVLFCPKDQPESLRDWVLETKRDTDRIVFYLHVDTKPRIALKAWHEAGLPLHNTWTIQSWRDLHKHFGNHWNNRIYEDFANMP